MLKLSRNVFKSTRRGTFVECWKDNRVKQILEDLSHTKKREKSITSDIESCWGASEQCYRVRILEPTEDDTGWMGDQRHLSCETIRVVLLWSENTPGSIRAFMCCGMNTDWKGHNARGRMNGWLSCMYGNKVLLFVFAEERLYCGK